MSQTPTPRDVRQMVRESRRLVKDVSDSQKETSDTRDEYIKHLEARCELQKQALDESKKLVNIYETRGGEREHAYKALIEHQEKQISHLNKTVEIQSGFLAMHGRILLRARHIEVHVEHRSLGHPPIPDAKVPELLWDDHWYFKNMQWGVSEEEAEKVWELSKWHYDNAVHTEDYRIPDVQAFVDDRPIPHPKKFRRSHYWNSDWLSVIPRHPRFRTPSPVSDVIYDNSDDDDEYWLESREQNRGDGSGPSSARE